MSNTINFSDTTPAAPTNPQGANVKWQNDTSSPPNVSGYIAPGLNGVPIEVALADSTGLVASTGTVTLFGVPSAGAGQYRLSWNAKITTAGTSPVIGPLTVTYVDPDGVTVTVIVPSSNSAGTVGAGGNSANSATSTGVMFGADILLNCKASTNITYSFPVSGTVGAGQWNLHIRLEYLG